MADTRRGYAESIRHLHEISLLDPGDEPLVPSGIPHPDDEAPGLSFFRTFIGEGVNLGNLTLPRTFVGRSKISDASFRNTDLSESNFCWNDISDADFTDASLANCDLRASRYSRVTFTRADLRGADLRHAMFEQCTFDGAAMDGAIVSRRQHARMPLSSSQNESTDWREDDGPEPAGG